MIIPTTFGTFTMKYAQQYHTIPALLSIKKYALIDLLQYNIVSKNWDPYYAPFLKFRNFGMTPENPFSGQRSDERTAGFRALYFIIK